MNLKICLAGAAAAIGLALVLCSGSSRTVELLHSKALTIRGAGDPEPVEPVPVAKEKCTEVFAQHACNTANSMLNCSGAGATCTTCKPAGAADAKVWICKTNVEFSCTPLVDDHGAAIDVDCGTKWKGTCQRIQIAPGVVEWFCIPANNTTAVCTKELKNKCA